MIGDHDDERRMLEDGGQHASLIVLDLQWLVSKDRELPTGSTNPQSGLMQPSIAAEAYLEASNRLTSFL